MAAPANVTMLRDIFVAVRLTRGGFENPRTGVDLSFEQAFRRQNIGVHLDATFAKNCPERRFSVVFLCGTALFFPVRTAAVTVH